jgi:hypothetical protein
MTLFAPDIFREIRVYTNKAAVAAVAAIYLVMPAVGTAANAAEDSAGALEDIVVTAQRKSAKCADQRDGARQLGHSKHGIDETLGFGA